MPFVSDTFTNPNGTVLSTHSASWTRVLGTGGATFDIQANRTRNTSAAVAYTHSSAPATPEFDLEFDFVQAGLSLVANQFLAAIFRYTDNSNYYWIDCLTSAAGTHLTIRLVKRAGGSDSVLGTYAFGLAPGAGTAIAIRGEIRDATKKVFVDGIERISSTDNALTSAGLVGLRGGAAAGTATGIHLDNLAGSDLVTEQALTPATETDTAQPLGATKRAALSAATETDAPQALTAQKITALTPVIESDAAQLLTGQTRSALTPASEADGAQELSATKLAPLAPALEADAARALAAVKLAAFLAASELDAAQPLSEVEAGTTPLTPAVETDQAQALSTQKLTALTAATESDGAQGVGSRKLAAILSATEADAAQALVSLTRMALVAALESDTTQPLSIRKLAALVAAAETDAAQPLSVAILNIGVIDGAGGISGADASSGEKALAGATPTETGLIE